MTPLDPKQTAKILTPAVCRLMDALAAAGGEARVVGGAVRDIVMGRAAGDSDLATNLPPQQVMDILTAAGIKTVPTGLVHGTITAVVDHVGYEITTLRQDIETDGRHAQVAFTNDWQADAARRDFTFNALYIARDEKLYDYFGGVEDALAGRVRFIGEARTRIREDVLRILRFYRFYAWFGRSDMEKDARAACCELAELMQRLSVERVAREALKLLAAPEPAAAWQMMIEDSITQHFLSDATDVIRLHTLIENEKQYAFQPSPLLRLAALLPSDAATADAVTSRLKLSNRDGDRLHTLARLPSALRGKLNAQALRRLLYVYKAENCRAALLLLDEKIDTALQTIAAWEDPVFPIKGEDIVRSGIPAGPRVGDILRAVENWWIDGDFSADRAACLAYATQYGKNH